MATALPQPSTSFPLNLLLVGRTGNGKSSTGNSIVRANKFTPASSTKTKITKPTKAEILIDETSVTVGDGVEIDDFSDNAKTTRTMADEAFSVCPSGFSALLIVLKYGVRFTKQEQDAIQMIKSVFGENVVQSHGIVVMTHGDNFDKDKEDKEISFEDWCRNQEGKANSLYRETGGRWILFDNKTKDEEKKRNQVATLLSLVNKIQNSSGCFSRRKTTITDTDRDEQDSCCERLRSTISRLFAGYT